jgi:hypothetical protein
MHLRQSSWPKSAQNSAGLYRSPIPKICLKSWQLKLLWNIRPVKPFLGSVVKSRTTERFRGLLARAPANIQTKARAAYRLWAENPSHPSLQFKKVHSRHPIYSVRVDLDWRAVGILHGADMVWFWIGPHDEYDRLLKQIHEPTTPEWRCSA